MLAKTFIGPVVVPWNSLPLPGTRQHQNRRHCTRVGHAGAHERVRAPLSSAHGTDGGNRSRRLLGGQSPAAFLRRFWQKEALLIRGALPDWTGIFARNLQALAGRRRRVRLVVRGQRQVVARARSVSQITFSRIAQSAIGRVVQGTNLHVAAADALLRRFAFLPYARFDDLMVSFAAPGGGVGPHIDSYDVFLLAGRGPSAVAIRAPGRSRAATRIARSRSSSASHRTTTMCWLPATCCPPAQPRARWCGARALPYVLDRLSRAIARGTCARLSRLFARWARAVGTIQ